LHVSFTAEGDVATYPIYGTGLLFPTTNTPHSFNSLKWVGNKPQSIITASQNVETFFLWSGKKYGEGENGLHDGKRMGSNNACFNNLIPHSLTYRKYRKFALPQNH
jgi:hypothetical protein